MLLYFKITFLNNFLLYIYIYIISEIFYVNLKAFDISLEIKG